MNNKQDNNNKNNISSYSKSIAITIAMITIGIVTPISKGKSMTRCVIAIVAIQ